MGSKKQDASAELLSELRALIVSGGSMGTLDEQKVRAVLEKINESYACIQFIATNPYADLTQPYYLSSMSYYRSKCLRDKRCVLTYLLWRQQKIAEAWWRVRDNLLEGSLSAAEAKYLSDYQNTMVEYMTSFDVPLDLRAYLWRPPSVRQLEVRGRCHYEFRSSVSGKTIIINTGDQLFLSFEEAEPLIQQGIVEVRMRVLSNSLSEAATQLEQDRERDFFRLLYIVDRARRFLSLPVSNVDWRLTCDCLDAMNHRYADTGFLLGFTGGYVLRNRSGRTLLSRFWCSMYLGLVFYDWELRRATRAPALEYWNSICTVDTEVGRIARVLHTPARFYEAAPMSTAFSGGLPPLRRGPSSSPAPASYGVSLRDALWRYMSDTMSSVLLMTLCSHLFEGSSWRHRTSDNVEVTALVINSRFFHWKVFEACQVRRSEVTEYNISLKWFPSFAASDSLRRSFQCRDLILEKSTLGGRLWYRTHFSLLRCLGLDSQ